MVIESELKNLKRVNIIYEYKMFKIENRKCIYKYENVIEDLKFLIRGLSYG